MIYRVKIGMLFFFIGMMSVSFRGFSETLNELSEINVKNSSLVACLYSTDYAWSVSKNDSGYILQKNKLVDLNNSSEEVYPAIKSKKRIDINFAEPISENRWLISENKGEFGGSLYSWDGRQLTKIISGNFNDVLKVDSKNYLLLEGISHLMRSEGQLKWLSVESDKIEIDSSFDLSSEPVSAFKDEKKVVILKQKGISLITTDNESKKITLRRDLEMEFPSRVYSITMQDGSYLVGARGAVFIVSKNQDIKIFVSEDVAGVCAESDT